LANEAAGVQPLALSCSVTPPLRGVRAPLAGFVDAGMLLLTVCNVCLITIVLFYETGVRAPDADNDLLLCLWDRLIASMGNKNSVATNISQPIR
jgi:hypothetical protein